MRGTLRESDSFGVPLTDFCRKLGAPESGQDALPSPLVPAHIGIAQRASASAPARLGIDRSRSAQHNSPAAPRCRPARLGISSARHRPGLTRHNQPRPGTSPVQCQAARQDSAAQRGASPARCRSPTQNRPLISIPPTTAWLSPVPRPAPPGSTQPDAPPSSTRLSQARTAPSNSPPSPARNSPSTTWLSPARHPT